MVCPKGCKKEAARVSPALALDLASYMAQAASSYYIWHIWHGIELVKLSNSADGGTDTVTTV